MTEDNTVPLRDVMNREVGLLREDMHDLKGDCDEIRDDVKSLTTDVHGMRDDMHKAISAIDHQLGRVVTWPALATALTLGVALCGLVLAVAR